MSSTRAPDICGLIGRNDFRPCARRSTDLFRKLSVARRWHSSAPIAPASPAFEGDGDPMDICVLTEKTFAHGSFFLLAKPIGGLRMIDGHQADDKIIAILDADLAYGHIQDISDVRRHLSIDSSTTS